MIRFDNTGNIKALAESYKIPPIPLGGETTLYEKGDRVLTSNLSPFKENTEFTIVSSYTQMGYVYYQAESVVGNTVLRTKDIKGKLDCTVECHSDNRCFANMPS
jgi:hypothetical protein